VRGVVAACELIRLLWCIQDDVSKPEMSNFTPIASTLGGLLIGVSASLLLILNGKVAGISGIFGKLLSADPDRDWRAAFVAGLVGAGLLFSWLRPSAIGAPPRFPLGVMVIAGLLVGVGVETGGGCTSGHGVCGISRGSKRSFVATLTFMATGIATVYVVRHLLGVRS
jgi:uncharacterized protein